MKTTVTYRIVAILALALVFAPVLNYSVAHVMEQGDHTHQQTDVSSSSDCHQTSKMDNCTHCDISLDSQSCDHANGSCDSSCAGHCVVSVAITAQTPDSSILGQSFSDSREQFALSIEPDSQLRPPQFA